MCKPQKGLMENKEMSHLQINKLLEYDYKHSLMAAEDWLLVI